MRVEVLNKSGKVLAASAPLNGDQQRGQVKWSTGDIAGLQGNVVRLRFTLHQGEFYSYRIQ